jgi:hypothetical protein
MKPVHAGLIAAFLGACTSQESPLPDAGPPPPPASPTLDLVLEHSSLRQASLRVYFDQSGATGCDATGFLQPGETRQEDDVNNPCPIATCVSELRLVRGDQIVEIAYVDPQAPGAFFPEHATETGLELEILGCGAPRRLPLWDNQIAFSSRASLVPGDPLRVETSMPSDLVSLMSVSYGFPLMVSHHTQAGASSVGVLVDHRSSQVSVLAVQKNEESDLDGLHVRRWSSLELASTELTLPEAAEGRWDITGASTGAAEVTLGEPGGPVTIRLTATEVSLDRPDDQGLLRWRGEPSDPLTGASFGVFELEQGATLDTLRLEMAGQTWLATTPHVTPATPLGFTLDSDTTFRVGFPALHFVNLTDAGDVIDLSGLSLRWQASHLVPLLPP